MGNLAFGAGAGLGALVLFLGSAPSFAQTDFKATFLGGNAHDRVQGVTRAPDGSVYVTGNTGSTNFASVFPAGAAGAFPGPQGGSDAFVAKLTPDLQKVTAWTYLGGSGTDRGYGVRVTENGEVVVIGFTMSADFPKTAGPGHAGLEDVFVSRFSGDLKALHMARMLGGVKGDNPRGNLDLDKAGNVYVGGRTQSPNFPTTTGSLQTTFGGGLDDGFVAKIAPDGSLAWSTFLGGSDNDAGYSGVRLMADGSVLTGGMTRSVDFPKTAGAFQTAYQGGDADDPDLGDGFVARLTPDGAGLVFSTYLGGSGSDQLAGNDALEVDAKGNVVVIGQTESTDMPVTSGAFQPKKGGATTQMRDGFVARLSADGVQLLACTYLSGKGMEELSALAVDEWGNVYVSGNTDSANFPTTPDAPNREYSGGSTDSMIVKLSPSLSDLIFSSFLGGSGTLSWGDRGRTATITPTFQYLLCGDTDSSDFPTTTGVVQSGYEGGKADGFVALWDLNTIHKFGSGKQSSIGTTPSLTWLGSPSASGGGLQLMVSGAVPHSVGCIVAGTLVGETDHQGGVLYVGGKVQYLPYVQVDAEGKASINVFIDPTATGKSRYFQFVYRDRQHPDGTGTGLSDAVGATVLP